MDKILIIPDVHGRDFWKTAKEKINEVDLVIFLGDYLDPYPHEGISKQRTIDNFKEILDFKLSNKDKVILLIGNHDLHYWPEFAQSWGCRRDDYNFNKISTMFLKNIEHFQLSYMYDRYLFTHAGVLDNWLKVINGEKNVRYTPFLNLEKQITLNNLNDLLFDNIAALWMISEERGGRDVYGSCLWADVHEHLYETLIPNVYQVFGHTMTYPTITSEYIGPHFAMLDAQSCYTLHLESGEFIKETSC